MDLKLILSMITSGCTVWLERFNVNAPVHGSIGAALSDLFGNTPDVFCGSRLNVI